MRTAPSCGATRTCWTRGSRRRSGRSRRSAGPTTRRSCGRYYPGDVNSTAREIIFLWENRMIMAGLELMGDIPFHDVIIHSTMLAPDGRRMSKSLGTGIDPVELIEAHGADATRYGLLKMSSGQDVRWSNGPVEEGRRLANKLWNASRLLLGDGGDRGRRAPVVARGALDPRAHRRDARGGRARLRLVRLRARRRPPLPPDVRRLLRLVPRVDQAAPRRRRGRAGDRVRGARAAARAAAPGDAARDGRDLVAPARARVEAHRRSVAGARHGAMPPTRTRSCACRRRRSGSAAAASRRRSKGTSSGSSTAVVRPERARHDGGRLEDEIARLAEGDRALAGDARERALHGACAGARRRGRAREARALPARARRNQRLTGSRRSARGRPTASGRSGCTRCSRASATRSFASRRSTSSVRTASRRRRG